MSHSVVIYGEDSPGSLYRSYRRGFEQQGATVRGYCPVRGMERAFSGARSRIVRRLFHGVAARRLNEQVRRDLSVERPDLILVLKGSDLSPETIAYLRAATGAVIANYYPDDPFSDIRSNRLTFGPAALSAYDVCFTFAKHLIPAYQSIGARVVYYLPFARDPEMHAPANDAGPPDFDIVFVGNLDDERIRWLEAVADYRLVIFGEHTRQALRQRSPLRSATFLPAEYGHGFARAIRRGAIALNVMRRQNAQSHNMRSFESPACQAFTMSQRTPELSELFLENQEMVCFGSVAELRAQVATWLARPSADRDAISAAGFRRVEHDTYARRAETVLQAAVDTRARSISE